MLARDYLEAMEIQVARAEIAVDSAVAFDANLKNDVQRKVRRAELLQTENYEKLLVALSAARNTATEAEIELNLLLNEFSVAKLETRRATAIIEAQAVA